MSVCVSECDIQDVVYVTIAWIQNLMLCVHTVLNSNLDCTKHAVSNSCILATLSHDYDIKHTNQVSAIFTGVPSTKRPRLDSSSQGTSSTYYTIYVNDVTRAIGLMVCMLTLNACARVTVVLCVCLFLAATCSNCDVIWFLMAFPMHDLCGFGRKRFVGQFWCRLLILYLSFSALVLSLLDTFAGATSPVN